MIEILDMPLQRITKTHLPTDYGDFDMYTFAYDETQQMPHLALVHPEADLSSPIILRIHSECLTGDLFASKRCDCGEQLKVSMEMIGKEKGMLIYLRQEGRGIGLINKMRAYNAQDEGMDTFDANVHLGFEPDERDFSMAIDILKEIGVSDIRLLTNNPEKLHAFDGTGIQLSERIPLIINPKEENKSYLETKMKKFGHLLKP